jgi:quinol-cytochrome oxidoreductase complex cytochrome b subunit
MNGSSIAFLKFIYVIIMFFLIKIYLANLMYSIQFYEQANSSIQKFPAKKITSQFKSYWNINQTNIKCIKNTLHIVPMVSGIDSSLFFHFTFNFLDNKCHLKIETKLIKYLLIIFFIIACLLFNKEGFE